MTVEETTKIVAATLRTVAPWAEDHEFRDMLYDVADQAEANWDDACCPVCEEVTCDQGCPFEEIRKTLEAKPDSAHP